jgi:manganese transport protein
MDPGNWATDIEAGARFGYDLLFVIAACSFSAMLLQWLSMRLGLVTGHDLGRMAREHYRPVTCRFLWVLAELAIVATDIAEVLGSALAFNLLFGTPLWLGVLLTAFDTLIVLGLTGTGFRQVEAIILGLVATIATCFAVQLAIAGPSADGILRGLIPKPGLLADNQHALYLAVGILGATVMPHNLYLHSSIVQSRRSAQGDRRLGDATRLATIDLVLSLLMATLVNGAILALAATSFHATGHSDVAEIGAAYHLLEPVTGAAAAAALFAIALFASGQSATFTGTIAGQVILEGFLDLRIPYWQRRLITRGLALIPALTGVLYLGDQAVGQILVLTQVVLSLQLPFAVYPLIRFTSNATIMGSHANGGIVRVTAWLLFGVISAANIWLVSQWIG